MINDALGDRMKDYEVRSQLRLPRRMYTVIRLDGKAFHTYTRGCRRPFDEDLMTDMDLTAKALCEQIQGCRLAYVQSDEITLVLTDFETLKTDAWFDGNIQKITSISASIATAVFNGLRQRRAIQSKAHTNSVEGNSPHWGMDMIPVTGHAYFDSRVFSLPEREEVLNCLIWRQQDATRNSISMAAQAYFLPKQLHGVSSNQMQELLFQERGINWNDYPAGFKRGRVVAPVVRVQDVEYLDSRTQTMKVAAGVTRRSWEIQEPPVFTQDRDYLYALIPARPR